MNIDDIKLTESEIQTLCIEGKSDPLKGTIKENQAVFDKFPKEIARRLNQTLEEIKHQETTLTKQAQQIEQILSVIQLIPSLNVEELPSKTELQELKNTFDNEIQVLQHSKTEILQTAETNCLENIDSKLITFTQNELYKLMHIVKDFSVSVSSWNKKNNNKDYPFEASVFVGNISSITHLPKPTQGYFDKRFIAETNIDITNEERNLIAPFCGFTEPNLTIFASSKPSKAITGTVLIQRALSWK